MGGLGGWVGGGGGGVKSFCLIGYKQWGRTALVTRPAVQWSNPGLLTFSAAAGGGAKVGRLGFEPPTTRMPTGCVTTRPLLGSWRMASLLLGAASATDKKTKLCVSV